MLCNLLEVAKHHGKKGNFAVYQMFKELVSGNNDNVDDENSQRDEALNRYSNDSDQDDNDQANVSNDDGSGGNGIGGGDDDGEYDPDAHTAKGNLLYATAADHTDADTPLVPGRCEDDTWHSLYEIQQVHTMSKQQADVFTLHAVMKELVLPNVKFIPDGDTERTFLKYTEDESSLCCKVITFTG